MLICKDLIRRLHFLLICFINLNIYALFEPL